MNEASETERPSTGGVYGQLRVLSAAVLVGVLAGAASAGFLVSLDWVTERRVAHPWTLWLLPVGGAAMAWGGARWGGSATQGNRLTMRQIRRLDDGVPLRMAPLVYIGTLVTHGLGGSAGREGTALQLAAGLTDGLASRARVPRSDRQLLLIASIAAGFGSVFGVPWAGLVFAVEISPTSWRRRLAAVPACVVAALVGDRTVALLGVHHQRYPQLGGVRTRDVLVAMAVAPLFGLCAWLFIRCTDGVKNTLAGRFEHPAARAVVGGCAVIALTVVIGNRDNNGLSIPLLQRAFGVAAIGLGVWFLKLLMTSLTVGSGYAGGEVTPLFVIGATLGSAIGHAVGGPVVLLAAVGMMATFGSAVNASLACAVMGVELFGWGPAIPLLLGCAIARLFSSGRSLYAHEQVPVEAELL